MNYVWYNYVNSGCWLQLKRHRQIYFFYTTPHICMHCFLIHITHLQLSQPVKKNDL